MDTYVYTCVVERDTEIHCDLNPRGPRPLVKLVKQGQAIMHTYTTQLNSTH